MNSLYEFDITIFRAINVDFHRSWLDLFFAFFSYLGSGGWLAAACLLFVLHKSTRHYVVPLLLTNLISGVAVADLLKVIIVRDRPSNLPYAIVQEDLHTRSFPSGHTTTAFAVAMMIVFLTADSRYRKLGYLSIFVAALIGLSRIYRGVHWPTDTIAGACFGIATSCVLFFLLPRIGLSLNRNDGFDSGEATSQS